MVYTASSSFTSGHPFSRSPATMVNGRSGCPITAARERHSSRSVFSCIRAVMRVLCASTSASSTSVSSACPVFISLRGILRDHGHVAPGIEQLLSGQHAQKGHLHGALHPHFLLFTFDLGELHIFSENPAAQSEFPARDYCLLQKKALLPAAHL